MAFPKLFLDHWPIDSSLFSSKGTPYFDPHSFNAFVLISFVKPYLGLSSPLFQCELCQLGNHHYAMYKDLSFLLKNFGLFQCDV